MKAVNGSWIKARIIGGTNERKAPKYGMKSSMKTKNAQMNAPGISNAYNATPAITAWPNATVALVLM